MKLEEAYSLGEIFIIVFLGLLLIVGTIGLINEKNGKFNCPVVSPLADWNQICRNKGGIPIPAGNSNVPNQCIFPEN